MLCLSKYLKVIFLPLPKLQKVVRTYALSRLLLTTHSHEGFPGIYLVLQIESLVRSVQVSLSLEVMTGTLLLRFVCVVRTL